MDRSEAVAEIYAWLASQSANYPAGIPEEFLVADDVALETVSILGTPFGNSSVQLLFCVCRESGAEISKAELDLLSGAITKGLELKLGDVALALVNAQSLAKDLDGEVHQEIISKCKETGARFFINCGGAIHGDSPHWIDVPTLSQSLEDRASKLALWEGLKVIKSQLLGGEG